MTVGVCGYGYSGSGAVLDLLKGYSETEVLDKFEFSFIYKPDGIEDLERTIVTTPSRYFSSDSSIRRFIQCMNRQKKRYNALSSGTFELLLDEYLNKIIQTTWLGSTSVHSYQDSGLTYLVWQKLARAFRLRFEKIFWSIKRPFPPDKKMYYSYMGDDFYVATRQFIGDFIYSLGGSSKIIVLDQPFAANNPEKSFPLFESPKAIVVNRDPRDMFVLAKTTIGMTGRFIPTNNVEAFIIYYRGLMKSKHIRSNDVLELNFEDLIYKHDETISLIENFLYLDKSKVTENSLFNPVKSINNTQLFLRYPQFKDDVQQIERELKPFIYRFDEYTMNE